MKIFVAYGYNDRDRWINELVFPIIHAFGDEAVTGEELQGEQITDLVRKKIQRSDALIAFTTRRKEISQNQWTTHRWVTDEIAQALAYDIPVVEVRERGVDDQGGINTGRQRISYDENARDRCLVELVKTIGSWHRNGKIKLQLMPDECAQRIRPFLRNPGLRCTYKLLSNEDGSISDDIPASILPITGGLFVQAKNVPHSSLIQLHIECSGKSWTSNFETTDSLGIHLQED